MSSHSAVRLALAIFVLVVSVGRAAAQETINYASISGQVLDPHGAAVPGAVVVVRQAETNVTAEATTNGQGRFRFPYLKVGTYDVVARLAGFDEAKQTLTLTLGAAFELPLTLAISGFNEGVTVSARSVVLEAARSQIASTISQHEVRALPMNGRNFLDLALLVPGVSPTNVGSTQLFAETSAVPGQGISVASQRNFSNNFIVDGLSANDDAAGLSGIPYGVDAIEQFQVITSGGQAELGRAIGGYISVVTKSGTNSNRGNLYGYFRDDAFNAANALSGRTLPMHQNQYGASLGGPLRRDRSFFFANVERKRLEQTGFVTVAPNVVDSINARLAAVGYPGASVSTGNYANPVRTTHFLGKVDHQISGLDQLGIRYSVYDAFSSNSRGAGGTSTPSASSGLDNRDQAIAFSNTLTLTPSTVNETRAQFTYGDLKALPSDPVGPNVSIAGVASFGTLSSSPQARRNKMFQVVNNLSHQQGAHALRGGVDFLVNADTITFPRSARGAYTFSSLANFLAGNYNNLGFTQTFGTNVVSQTNPNLGVYVQDEWRATGGLTINAGLRYDLQFLQTINTDTNNIAPRVGFAWVPSASRDTVVRGSAGLFYDRIPLRALANALLSAGNTTDLNQLRQINVSLSLAQAGAPTFPNTLAAPVPTVTLPNLTTMDRDIQNARSTQVSLEVERRFGGYGTYSIGYQYLRGANLIVSINQNVPSCVAAGSNNGCRPNPSYANNTQYSSTASSNYHGLHLSFVQRPVSWGSLRVSYTLSKSMNNVGENFFSSPIDPFDLSKDWGRSDDDQRHRLVINGAVNTSTAPGATLLEKLTHGFQLSGTVQTYSSLPFNITSGVTTVQGTAGRPMVDGAFIVRNAGAGSDYFSTNLRLSRSFSIHNTRLEAALEGFNLTNRQNNITRNGNFGSGSYPSNPAPGFNTITAVADPRTFQFALRVSF